MELQHYCPECDEKSTFHLRASVEIDLGRKEKWDCEECDYKIVTIGSIDSVGTASA